jgi:hypothetical protein
MLTATKDLMLPATVTGSWPRPQGDRDRAGAKHRPEGARARGALRAGGRPVTADGRAPGPGAADAPAVTLEVASAILSAWMPTG